MSTPCVSVTSLYGARSSAVPIGASIVTQRWLPSSGSRPAHQLGSPRPVTRQYANCRLDGGYLLHHGSSAPFHRPMPAADGSFSSVVTTLRRSASEGFPGIARLTVARFIQVWAPRDSAAASHASASAMSALVQGSEAGPTLNRLTPAPTSSSSALVPDGVVPVTGGPFASTIGKIGWPASTNVPFASNQVPLAGSTYGEATGGAPATSSGVGATSTFSCNVPP